MSLLIECIINIILSYVSSEEYNTLRLVNKLFDQVIKKYIRLFIYHSGWEYFFPLGKLIKYNIYDDIFFCEEYNICIDCKLKCIINNKKIVIHYIYDCDEDEKYEGKIININKLTINCVNEKFEKNPSSYLSGKEYPTLDIDNFVIKQLFLKFNLELDKQIVTVIKGYIRTNVTNNIEKKIMLCNGSIIG